MVVPSFTDRDRDPNRNRKTAQGGPSGVQRSYASELRESESLFNSYEHLQGLQRGDAALKMLRQIASLVKPIMRKRGWTVQILAEFLPPEQNLLGLNVNKGYKICLRLRYHNNPDLFLPTEQVVDTMLHELSHNQLPPIVGRASRFTMAPDEIAAWKSLAQRVARAAAELAQEEEDLGEPPDEFLDPLMSELMTDPVILPSSRTTMDRSTIKQHLLSDPTDPFNRVPLRIEEVVADTEMRGRIEEWKAERLVARRGEKEAAAAKAAAAESEAMDTSQ
ncbi:hypothetical protein LTR87_016215 [Friedmanniomyces endolithicus]|nr:hypothetical protein LTR87_016215 [Friedmanniomyces endolithicus]